MMKSVFRRKTIFWFTPVALMVLMSMFVVPLVFSPQHASAAAPVDQLVGYGAGTTGGAGGPTTTVSSLSALTSAVSGNSAKIVKVSGTISGNADVTVGSNTTILGVGSSGSLVGISLKMKGVSNIIIRNLKISKVLADSTTGDAIHIESSTKIWIDHNDLSSDLDHDKDYYDGLIDITHAGDYITVSWNRLHDHYKVSLVGHSDSNGSEDIGHLHVTYHHNWFYNVSSRLPSLRFGTGHIYNNLFENASSSGINSRMGAQTLIENNVFNNVKKAIVTDLDSDEDGYAVERGNIFNNSPTEITQVGSFTQAPYSYTLDSASSVTSIVKASSGVGIVSGGNNTNPTPTPTPTRTPTPQPGVTPTPTPTTPPSSGGSCRVSYSTNDWPGGFTANITITNGSSALNGWSLVFTFPGNQQVQQGWNANFSQSGNQVTATNVSYNATLAAGASVAIGFNGSWSGSNPEPSSFTLNGASCSVA